MSAVCQPARVALRPRLTVAEIIRAHGDQYVQSRGGTLPLVQAKVLRALAACRTAALGGHATRCDHCGRTEVWYNSCRDRHCPQCQAAARAQWLEARCAELLPVEYFHLVFTLPHELVPLVRLNRRAIFDLLFRASADTLLELTADAKWLGARIGFLSVLHTWGQNLELHPHVHCVVTGGGVSPDDTRWVFTRPRYFLPVKVLSRVFRGKFLAGLRQLHRSGSLRCEGKLARLADPRSFATWLAPLYAKEWVVHAKPPFGGPEQVLKYLARYTHRVAISNDRLVSLADGQAAFRWKNYARGGKWQTMTLAAGEFLRRFLEHVTPPGFVRMRYYGLWANADRGARLAVCRALLATAGRTAPPTSVAAAADAPSEDQPRPCALCGQGRVWLVAEWPRPTLSALLAGPLVPSPSAYRDTS